MGTENRRLILREKEAQALLLVRAVEEADRGFSLLNQEERLAATRRARAGRRGSKGEGWIAARAVELSQSLGQDIAELPRFLRWSNPVRGMAPPVLSLAFLLGLASNALGPTARINVLAVPLLALIAWNLCMLGLLLLSRWLPLLAAASRGKEPRILGLFRRLAQGLARRWAALSTTRLTGDGEPVLGPSMRAYLAEFWPAIQPLAAARARRLMHAAALVLVTGAVLGMYWRGLGIEYKTAWESTFLSPQAVDRLLGWVLGPAASLLAVQVPSAASVAAGAKGEAALLIHLYALTAGLFVGLPRFGLTLWEGWRCWRLGSRLAVSVPEVYVRRTLAAVEGSVGRVEILPYSYSPKGPSLDNLRVLLARHFGPRAELFSGRSLQYGENPASKEGEKGDVRVLVFTLAQTPEVEVHAEALRSVKDGLGEHGALLAAIDAGPYRSRLGSGSGRRLLERQEAWGRVLRQVGLRPLHLDLSQAPEDADLVALAGALWPTGTPVEES